MDRGLANLLCLESLIHGTGPKGFIGISLNGADPNFGGGSTGSTSSLLSGRERKILLENAQNYFYLFKDSELSETYIPYGDDNDKLFNFFSNNQSKQIIVTLLAKYHAIGGGLSTFTYEENKPLLELIKKSVGGLLGFLTPTLKFRFTFEDVLKERRVCSFKRETELSIRKFLGDFFSFFSQSGEDYFNPQNIEIKCSYVRVFENDSDYEGWAYRTKEAISASHLGITGSLTQGLDKKTLSRMSQNSEQVLNGVFFLTLALAVGYLTCKHLKYTPKLSEATPTFRNEHWIEKINIAVRTVSLTSFWLMTAMSLLFLNTL